MNEKKYKSKLNLYQTQKAIKFAKDTFEKKLAEKLNLDRVTAPLVLESDSKMNDDLGLQDSAISFSPKYIGKKLEIVQSLAKWKRVALKKYGYSKYEGIYTDMNAIRPLDQIDNLHSLYVDQWDWELIIDEKDRNLKYLKETVRKIVRSICQTKTLLNKKFPVLSMKVSPKVYFISSKNLYKLYPDKTPEEREILITKKYKTVFVFGIGYKLGDNLPHSVRAADYDDFNLNGDLLVWSDILNKPVELSSMGIRVDKKALIDQIKYANRCDLLKTSYHIDIINNNLPFTIGGGIGQSRLCMILLEKNHIAEIQVSAWDDESLKYFKDNEIEYL